MNAREQAKEAGALAVQRRVQRTIQHGWHAADAASDIWEPIAKTLIKHVPGSSTKGMIGVYCGYCGLSFPCVTWRRARDKVLGNE